MQSRKDFAHGSKSDHVALLNAFSGWTEAMSQSRAKEFADQRFLHWGTLNMIRGKLPFFECFSDVCYSFLLLKHIL